MSDSTAGGQEVPGGLATVHSGTGFEQANKLGVYTDEPGVPDR